MAPVRGPRPVPGPVGAHLVHRVLPAQRLRRSRLTADLRRFGPVRAGPPSRMAGTGGVRMTAALRLRPYQTEALEAIREAWASGVLRPAVVLPTGMGKTVI